MAPPINRCHMAWIPDRQQPNCSTLWKSASLRNPVLDSTPWLSAAPARVKQAGSAGSGALGGRAVRHSNFPIDRGARPPSLAASAASCCTRRSKIGWGNLAGPRCVSEHVLSVLGRLPGRCVQQIRCVRATPNKETVMVHIGSGTLTVKHVVMHVEEGPAERFVLPPMRIVFIIWIAAWRDILVMPVPVERKQLRSAKRLLVGGDCRLVGRCGP